MLSLADVSVLVPAPALPSGESSFSSGESVRDDRSDAEPADEPVCEIAGISKVRGNCELVMADDTSDENGGRTLAGPDTDGCDAVLDALVT